MAFGLSERTRGADVYNTDMVLTPASDEDRANGILYRATGEKYYIGNGNVASMVSVFGRRGDIEGSHAYIWFAADSGHDDYHLIDNVKPASQAAPLVRHRRTRKRPARERPAHGMNYRNPFRVRIAG